MTRQNNFYFFRKHSMSDQVPPIDENQALGKWRWMKKSLMINSNYRGHCSKDEKWAKQNEGKAFEGIPLEKCRAMERSA